MYMYLISIRVSWDTFYVDYFWGRYIRPTDCSTDRPTDLPTDRRPTDRPTDRPPIRSPTRPRLQVENAHRLNTAQRQLNTCT